MLRLPPCCFALKSVKEIPQAGWGLGGGFSGILINDLIGDRRNSSAEVGFDAE
jgi:hypothetical protein